MDTTIFAALIGAVIPILFQLVKDYRQSRKSGNKETDNGIAVPEETRIALQKIKKMVQRKRWARVSIIAVLVGLLVYGGANLISIPVASPPILAITYTFTPSLTPTVTLTPTVIPAFTSTVTSTVTPLTKPAITLTSNHKPTKLTNPVITPNTYKLIVIPGRPEYEVTFCSQDQLHPAGIRVIARWLKDSDTRGFYIAVQESMGISKIRVDGWDYMNPTQVNEFPYKNDHSKICEYDALWSVWIDENATDPTTSTKINIDFLNSDGSVIEQVGFNLE